MTELKTNVQQLVRISVQGKIHSPTMRGGFKVSHNGMARILPSVGGIVYNYKIGDDCMRLAGDHVEPGVSLKNPEMMENECLMHYACIGNEALVVDGDAKGARGFVTGKHGGIEHVMCYFASDDLEKMKIGDSILIKGEGLGLQLLDYPWIDCLNLSPVLLEKLELRAQSGGLEVPCVAEVPAWLMGSGIGAGSAYTGDYDIMTGDEKALEEHGLSRLRFGDLVLLKDCDNRYGRQYLKGARTLGVVIHSNCILAGHGPGVTALLSSAETSLVPRFDADANLANYFL